ncbi:MAG: zf-HC2 domain-containing protein [Acidimicrobiales bacterium]|nr:zf-HC2 domain-containing protein [Acidimicrobiales bacterium]
MSDHDRYRDLTAAYVLGALDPGERTELHEHLQACERCQADVIDFAPLPALLGSIEVDDLVEPPTPHLADAVVAEARGELERIRASRRRWRTIAAALAGAAVVAVALGVAAMVLDLDSGTEPERDRIELAFEAVADTTGDVVVDERGWGTYVHLSFEGLPERDLYRLWAVDQAGTWHEAGSWLPTPDRSATLGGSTHLRPAEIAVLVVTSGDRDDELGRAS